MHLVQLLLPDNPSDLDRPQALFAQVRTDLTDRFGGLTAYSRAPADGLWKPTAEASTSKDAIVVYEVMVADLNRSWWAEYRRHLEGEFEQQEIVVRAWEIEPL